MALQSPGFFEASRIEFLFDESQQNKPPPQAYPSYPQYPSHGAYPMPKPESGPLDRLLAPQSYSIDPSYQSQFMPRVGYGQHNLYNDYANMNKPDRGFETYMG